jgi:hypothetical protein
MCDGDGGLLRGGEQTQSLALAVSWERAHRSVSLGIRGSALLESRDGGLAEDDQGFGERKGLLCARILCTKLTDPLWNESL